MGPLFPPMSRTSLCRRKTSKTSTKHTLADTSLARVTTHYAPTRLLTEIDAHKWEKRIHVPPRISQNPISISWRRTYIVRIPPQFLSRIEKLSSHDRHNESPVRNCGSQPSTRVLDSCSPDDREHWRSASAQSKRFHVHANDNAMRSGYQQPSAGIIRLEISFENFSNKYRRVPSSPPKKNIIESRRQSTLIEAVSHISPGQQKVE